MPDYIITMVDNIAQSRIKTLTEKTRSFTKRTKLPFYPVSDKNLESVFPPLSRREYGIPLTAVPRRVSAGAQTDAITDW